MVLFLAPQLSESLYQYHIGVSPDDISSRPTLDAIFSRRQLPLLTDH